MRSTTHWPGGGVQSSDPSLPIFDVRSRTSLFRTASAGANGRRPEIREAGQRHECRLLLEPGHARSGVQHELGDLVRRSEAEEAGGRSPSAAAAAGVTNVTLKKRA